MKRITGAKKKVVIASGIILGILVLLVATAEFTSRPKFCTTCHYMQPFYDSWSSSSHKDVPCVKCHFPPGLQSAIESKTIGIVHIVNYVSQFYKKSRPMAEVSDASCLRSGCHDKRLIAGKVTFKGVHFDHTSHLTKLRRGKKLRCTSCHSQIVQGKHIDVTETTCFLCHFKNSEGDPTIHKCTLCHEAPTKANSTKNIAYDHTNVINKNIACERCHTQMIIGDGAVPKQNCYHCHWEEKRLQRYDDFDFLHKKHITEHKIECEQCHTPIQHKLPQTNKINALDCLSCHVNSHKAQITLFTGKGGYDAHPAPNPMYSRTITCKGCHVFHEDTKQAAVNGSTFTASKKSCQNCHGKGFSRLLEQWKSESQKKLNELKNEYAKTLREVTKSTSAKKTKAAKLLKRAKYNIDIVEQGKSVHNVQFADNLLRGAHNDLVKALKIISSPWSLSAYKETSKNVPTECNSCHYGVVSKKVQIFGVDYSHQNHVVKRKIACRTCHSNDRRHGELIITKSKCASCHHNAETENCNTCHSLQASVYSGKLQISFAAIKPDTMFQSEVACTDCHNYADKQTVVADTNSCLECHDEGTVADNYLTLRDSTINSIHEVESWLRDHKNLNFTPEQKKDVEGMKNVLAIMKNDGSKGVHNPVFYHSAMDEFRKKIKSINSSKEKK
ncbi:MAG: hypothetical protein GXO75_01490 [Calditrichaeota bacterium]|nr:hypothetical protein [Calditrichota bacterium]